VKHYPKKKIISLLLGVYLFPPFAMGRCHDSAAVVFSMARVLSAG
jgi:hypothetical protein